MTRQSKDPKYIRFEMVRYARENGVKPAARAFVKTVHKWLNPFVPGSLDSLNPSIIANSFGDDPLKFSCEKADKKTSKS